MCEGGDKLLEKENKKVQNNEKRNLFKIKRRVCIGGCAIFVVTCYELWNIPDVAPAKAIFLALYMATAISFLGYFFVKKIMLPYFKKEKE